MPTPADVRVAVPTTAVPLPLVVVAQVGAAATATPPLMPVAMAFTEGAFGEDEPVTDASPAMKVRGPAAPAACVHRNGTGETTAMFVVGQTSGHGEQQRLVVAVLRGRQPTAVAARTVVAHSLGEIANVGEPLNATLLLEMLEPVRNANPAHDKMMHARITALTSHTDGAPIPSKKELVDPQSPVKGSPVKGKAHFTAPSAIKIAHFVAAAPQKLFWHRLLTYAGLKALYKARAAMVPPKELDTGSVAFIKEPLTLDVDRSKPLGEPSRYGAYAVNLLLPVSDETAKFKKLTHWWTPVGGVAVRPPRMLIDNIFIVIEDWVDKDGDTVQTYSLKAVDGFSHVRDLEAARSA